MKLKFIKIKLSNIINDINISRKIVIKNLNDNFNTEKVSQRIYMLVLVLLVLMTLFIIEYEHPYFFLQDDNRDYFLPYFIYNFESLLKGELAIYNFHQFLGTPSLAVGQSQTLYPIMYVSVFISRLFYGHYFAAVDIEVIIHLLIGAIGVYKLIKFFQVNEKIGFFAALTWPLSSFIIYTSNSWIIVSGVAAYFPWMLLWGFKIYKTPTLKVAINSVIFRLFLFYAGSIQYFIYSMIFEFITVILFVRLDCEPDVKRVKIIKFFKNYIEGLVCVFILSLPLLLPMWHQTTISAERSEPLPIDVFASGYFPAAQLFKDLLYPFGLFVKHTPWLFENENLFGFAHIGFLTVIFLIIGIIVMFIKKEKNKNISSVGIYVFAIPALIAFLWATSLEFNTIIYVIPILNRFRWPFKLDLYLDFYLIIIAAFMLADIIIKFSWKRISENIIIFFIIAIQLSNFIFIYTVCSYKTFRYHGDNLPLEEKLKDKLMDGRIISIGFDKSENNLTAPFLAFNYATLFGLDYFAGYEPLISSENSDACLKLNYTSDIKSDDVIPVDYLRKSGVKWYIVPKNMKDKYSNKFYTYGIIERYEDENRIIFYDDKAYPMIYNSEGEKIDQKDYIVKTNSVELSVNNKQANTITFNYIYNSFFEGIVDGEKIKLTSNDNIHFTVSVPEGNHKIIIKYNDPYLIVGIYISLVFLIAFAIRCVLDIKLINLINICYRNKSIEN